MIFHHSPNITQNSAEPMWINYVNNCGKNTHKKVTKNLSKSDPSTFIQDSENAKKVSSFLIVNYQRHFSPILA